MFVNELLGESVYDCQVIYLNENGDIVESMDYEEFEMYVANDPLLSEASVRQFRRVDNELKRQFRCLTGPKAGMIVSTPQACAKRKNPKRRRAARRVARQLKNVRIRKTKMAKKKSISKIVTRLNKRLRGEG